MSEENFVWWRGLQIFCLVLSYVGLGLGFIPFLKMNRATIALVGSTLMIVLGVVSLEESWQLIDVNTIVFLLSMMIINSYLSFSGFFNLVIYRLLQLSLTPFSLLIILSISTAFLSALFLNDTLVLVTTPLVLRLTASLNLNPIPYLLAVASATNIGSVPTLNGNPQNILVASFSELSYAQFTQALLPITIISLILQIVWLYYLYPEVRCRHVLKFDHSTPVVIHKSLLIKSLIVSTLMLISFVLGMPLGRSALVTASLLLITKHLESEQVLEEINWSLLLMFSGLFILTGCVQSLNLLTIFAPFVDSKVGLVSVTVILANLISNVPAVLLLKDMMVDNQQNWLLLASSATLAGNLTLFGSVANLIMVEAVKSQGYNLSFWQHFRFGFPLTIVSLLPLLIL
ncbi:MAG: anion transporter [Cyanobacterium sp. T60_A2020_053]|nr:anion transporter [Cyanobacterium sp. T60_A2020_053]